LQPLSRLPGSGVALKTSDETLRLHQGSQKAVMSSILLRFAVDDLRVYTVVGEKNGGFIHLRSGPGYGLFGPYVTLPAGRCVARIFFEGPKRGRATVDLCAESGEIMLASRVIDLGTLEENFAEIAADLGSARSACEVRLLCPPEIHANISAIEIELFEIPESLLQSDGSMQKSALDYFHGIAKDTGAIWLETGTLLPTGSTRQKSLERMPSFVLSLDKRTDNGIFLSEIAFLRQLNPTSKILDVGCGNNSPHKIKSILPECNYTGIDVGDYDQTKPNLADNYVLTSPENFADEIYKMKGQFDAVISTHTIEHCNEREKTVDAMLKAIKPSGQLYMLFPSEISADLPSRGGGLNYFDDGTHKDFPPKFDELVSTIRRNDFRIMFAEREYKPIDGLHSGAYQRERILKAKYDTSRNLVVLWL
jgi:2-polyprenyl-3-methyl-5-hydroxy-6-metoxy-1,4-benzoquinol methylase